MNIRIERRNDGTYNLHVNGELMIEAETFTVVDGVRDALNGRPAVGELGEVADSIRKHFEVVS